VFFRSIALPTSSIRRAKAAIELQFDRLSPIPRNLAAFDVVPLRIEDNSDNFAIGIVAKDQLAAHGGEGRSITLHVQADGQALTFRFSNRQAVRAQAARLLTVSPSLFLPLVSLTILASAVNYRLNVELEAAETAVLSLQKATAKLHTIQTDRQSAWLDWTAAAGDRIAENSSCALQRLGQAGVPTSVKLFEAGVGAIHVTFAGPLPQTARQRIDPRGDLTWLDDGDSEAQWVKFGANACS
jgi:hypothetical protein